MNTDPKWIVWSYDDGEHQTFVDIVKAEDAEAAAKKVQRKRPYATLDLYIPPNRLTEYTQHLLKALGLDLPWPKLLSTFRSDEMHLRCWYPDVAGGKPRDRYKASRKLKTEYRHTVKTIEQLQSIVAALPKEVKG